MIFRETLRIFLSALCVGLLAASIPGARAQEYPNQTVKIVVPFVAALVDPQRSGGLEHLSPDAIDQQHRWGIGDRLGAPGVHG